MTKSQKIAIVTDWLTTRGGAEKVVKTISDIYPNAPIYTSQYSAKEVDWFKNCDVRTGWLNIFPARFRKLLSPLRALYFSHLKLGEYDVVISIVSGECKGIKTNSNQTHISYLQGPPTQYYWGMYEQYLRNPGFGRLNFLIKPIFRLLAGRMRKVDYKLAQQPDHLITISSYCAAEIKKYYNRSAEVIFPPVRTNDFKLSSKKGDFFLVTGRQANWKRLDIVIKACAELGYKLMLVGDGAEHRKLVDLAKENPIIEFVPWLDNMNELTQLVSESKGFILSSLEPFGIAPVEALATGTPVIAYQAGGALDYIDDGMNGIFFDEQNPTSLKRALQRFNKLLFDSKAVSATAQRFTENKFKKHIRDFVKKCSIE
jgi:glycosyltransferase involved in cell wall biosynthesis